jgi:hypothetical protein
MSSNRPKQIAAIEAARKHSDPTEMDRALKAYADEGDIVISVRLRNLQAHPVTLYLEPWADQIDLTPNAVAWAFLCGPNSDRLQEKMHVEFEKDAILVYGWTGSIGYIMKEASGS